MNIPILSHILRGIEENLWPIKKSLKTSKKTEGKIKKKKHFLGLINVVSGKRFEFLKLKRE